VELGETIAEALVREVQEETGLWVQPARFLGHRDAIERDDEGRVRYHYVILYFEATVLSGQLQAADDAAEVRWVSAAELEALPVTDAVTHTLRWSM
jgi:8-oxo-dGTP diphosphatase